MYILLSFLTPAYINHTRLTAVDVDAIALQVCNFKRKLYKMVPINVKINYLKEKNSYFTTFLL